MKTTIDTYPVFDANQVLTDDHLNTVVNYLDEQDRLTRANLVGIGVACGLDLTIPPGEGRVEISRGCAVSSQGYLLLEPEDVALTSYRAYELPPSDAYAAFQVDGEQLPLWELLPDGSPGATPLDSPADFLKDKAVLLFLEQNREDLSDCSPNNCDDKGAEVTVTLRRLLVDTAGLQRITEDLGAEGEAAARLALPDLRMHRFDVPATGPVTTRALLTAFQDMVKKDALPTALHDALEAAYEAFQPLLLKAYPASPFAGFLTLYGFLEAFPTSARQVVFLPCYVDLFSDLLAAYDEFRARAQEDCQCCPPEDWFPRHVVLGPERRTGWVPAAAAGCGCTSPADEVVTLFRRLVEISQKFTDTPSLRERTDRAIDDQIRITPSRQGAAPLSTRCIPYYYDFTGTPPLYQLWSPALTAQGRPHHNQGYRCNEYAPPAPPFVKAPLSFDLEPFDFFRVEGHLGKDFRAVLATLLAARDTFRLPFDVVALRTGTPEGSQEVDLTAHACRFQDLDAAYRMLREELSCLARKCVTSVGRTKLQTAVEFERPTGTTIQYSAAVTRVMGLPFEEAQKKLRVQPNTVLAAYFDNRVNYGDVPLMRTGESAVVNAAFTVFENLDRLTSLLAERLEDVDWVEFEKTVQRLQKLSEDISHEGSGEAGGEDLTWDELNRQIVSVVFACRLEGFLTLRDEYLRRVEQIRKLAAFEGYAEEHPAIQHKAGVPVGGTLVLVYHGSSQGGDDGRDAYSLALANLRTGAVVADFCLPYRCCSDCAPIQFVLDLSEPVPQPPSLVVANTGCTGDEGAEVNLQGSGGKPPYTLTVDGEARPAFPSAVALTLAPGTHVLQITDADQVAAAPVTLTIAEALAGGEVTYTDDTVAQTYAASFQVTGGELPYATSMGMVANDVITVTGLASGTTTVTVSDGHGCSTTVTLQHAVPAPCKLPCNGDAFRIRFPVWAPHPGSTPYQFRVREWRVQLTDERGNREFDQNLAELVGSIVGDSWIEESNFADVVQAVCTAVTTTVQKALPKEYGTDAFVLGYDPRAGTLVVEAYACHIFGMRVQFTLASEGQDRRREERWTYDPKTVKVEQNTGTSTARFSMPGFGRIEMNKCTHQVGRDCAVDLKTITPKVEGENLVLTATFGEGVNPEQLAFHWHVNSPIVKYSSERELELPRTTQERILVQLLVISKEGCWAFTETALAPDRRTPLRVVRRRR